MFEPAEHHRPGGLQLLDHRRVVGRHEIAKDLRAAIERLSLYRNDILDADGHAEQRLLGVGLALRERLVGGVGLGQRIRGVVADERLDLAIHALDPVQTRLRGGPRGDFALGQPAHQL